MRQATSVQAGSVRLCSSTVNGPRELLRGVRRMSVALVATVLAAGAAVADVNRHRDDVMLEEALRAARGEPSAPLEGTVGIGMSSAERARL